MFQDLLGAENLCGTEQSQAPRQLIRLYCCQASIYNLKQHLSTLLIQVAY